MKPKNIDPKIILGGSIILAFTIAAMILGNSLITFKKLDRFVTVKGLAEQEYPADIVIWPITFNEASNNLSSLYTSVENNKNIIISFLLKKGISMEDISISAPQTTDKQALAYSGNTINELRYVAQQNITLRSTNIILVRELMSDIIELGKKGIAFSYNTYDNPIQYIFSKLNEVKPTMIEESTKDARNAALKFAVDSKSKLGKIKKASQGQFTISDRDANNPHIKTVRVVSTIEYYLSD